MVDISNGVWSETDSLNNSQTTMPGFHESMNPGLVDDAARAMMGAMRRWYDRTNPTQTSGGTANAQTLTYDVAPSSYVAGDLIRFIAGYTNTSATTLDINTLGDVSVLAMGNALTGGETAPPYPPPKTTFGLQPSAFAICE